MKKNKLFRNTKKIDEKKETPPTGTSVSAVLPLQTTSNIHLPAHTHKIKK
jgi:hypothetical protein